MIQSIVPAVQAHSEGVAAGAIAVDAYNALALDLLTPARRKLATPDVIKSTIEPIQSLLAARLALYRKGIPPQPAAETRGTSYLTNGAIWSVQTPTQQVRSMQLMSDLLSLAAQQSKAAKDPSELILTIVHTAKAMSVAADASGAPQISQVLLPLTQLKGGTSPDEVLRLVNGVYPVIKGVVRFAAVTPPPTVEPGATTRSAASTAQVPSGGAVK